MFKNDEEYFADSEFVSNSQLKDFDFCQYLYEGKHITKIFKDEEEHDYFTYGSAVDCLLTEPEGTFEQKFFPIDRRIDVEDEDQLRADMKMLVGEIADKKAANKPCKMLEDRLDKMQIKLASIQDIKGKQQITTTMFQNVSDSAQELLRQPLYKMFGVNDGKGSQAILAMKVHGLRMKGKLDYINVEKRVIADVKTVSTMERFDPKVYARQLAYYRLLASVEYATPKEDWDCYLLVVDKGSATKRSEIFYISKYLIDQATEELMESLEKFKKVKEAGFYTPATEGDDLMDARHNKCFKCAFYNECSFSVQKDITVVE